MPRDTTAHVRGGQAVPAHKHACVCVSQPLSSPTSTWIRAATTAAETSRPRCSLGGGTPSMQLLSHLCAAVSRWPTAIHGRHQATRPWPLTRCCGHTLSSSKCVLHGPRHTALCSAPLSAALHSRLPWSMCHHHHHEQQQQMRLSPLLARMAASSAADACARQQADRLHCH